MLIDQSLAEFAAATSERTSTPGGGAVAAYLATLGAALGAMAARFTSGREEFAEAEPRLAAAIADLDGLRVALLELVDADAEAFGGVTDAYALPHATPDDKAARRAAIQVALGGAMEVPLQTCRTAVGGLDVLATLCNTVHKHLASDVAVGALALAAGYRAAWINVVINLSSMKDAERIAAVRAEGEEMERHVAEREQSILAAVMDVIS